MRSITSCSFSKSNWCIMIRNINSRINEGGAGAAKVVCIDVEDWLWCKVCDVYTFVGSPCLYHNDTKSAILDDDFT